MHGTNVEDGTVGTDGAGNDFRDGRVHYIVLDPPAFGGSYGHVISQVRNDAVLCAILVNLPSGKDIVIGGQKSGDVVGVDPDTGKTLWKNRIGRGGVQGGVHFGIAAQDNVVYVPINDTLFTGQFKRILKDAGVKVVRTSLHAPNMNAIAERFVLSVKCECLDRMILFGYEHLERCLADYSAHYNLQRPH